MDPQSQEEWIGLREAAGLVPSPRPGKKTHISTVFRWCEAGKLECRRRGRWWFVRRADVLALLTETPGRKPDATPGPSRRQQRGRSREWAKRVLDAAGIG
jgi:hypothetical protein